MSKDELLPQALANFRPEILDTMKRKTIRIPLDLISHQTELELKQIKVLELHKEFLRWE